MAHFDVLTVRQMIDAAFSEADNNCPINFNMVGSVLFILARRMALLKRRFKIEMQERMPQNTPSKYTFMVTEIKIHTKGKRKRRNTKLLKDNIDQPSDKMHKARKRSISSRYKRSPRKHFFNDDDSGTSSDERSTKRSSHKRSDDKYLKNSLPRKIYRSERLKVQKDSDETSLPERQARKHERHGSNIEAEAYSDNRSLAVRPRANKSPVSRHKAEYSDETSPVELRKYGKYHDDMSPTEKRKSRKSPSKRETIRESIVERRKAGKHSEDMSPYDETSDESSISRKSRTGKPFDQKGKTNAEGQPLSHRGRFEKEGYGSKLKYDAYQDSDDDNLETHHEKIYVVTRTPSGREIKIPAVNFHPVVTQEQFNHILKKTRQLQKKFGIATKWDDFRKTTFMTDPKVALNIVVRLDKAESRLASILNIVTQLASQGAEIDLQATFNEISLRESRQETSEPPDAVQGLDTSNRHKITFGDVATTDKTPVDDALEFKPTKSKDNVTYQEFNNHLQRLHRDVVRYVEQAIADTRIEKYNQVLRSCELRVNGIQTHFQHYAELNYTVEKIGRTVASIDVRMSSQMAVFQDNLLHMQEELESALEKVSDSILSPKEDAAAVAQITESFKAYKSDLIQTDAIQVDLKEEIENLFYNLESVTKIIEEIRNRKCTRQQMFEALDNKLTLKDINGLLTQVQFGAVFSNNVHVMQNIQMNIFSGEYDWQVYIDIFIIKCDACADSIQIKILRESIQKCFDEMDKDLDDMFAIVIPPKRYPTDKEVERDEKCLSCGAPPVVVKDELNLKLWQEIAVRAVSDVKLVKLKDKAISATCIPGRPIPHPLEQDSFICKHDCGEIDNTKEEVLELFVKKLKRDSQTVLKNKPQVEDN